MHAAPAARRAMLIWLATVVAIAATAFASAYLIGRETRASASVGPAVERTHFPRNLIGTLDAGVSVTLPVLEGVTPTTAVPVAAPAPPVPGPSIAAPTTQAPAPSQPAQPAAPQAPTTEDPGRFQTRGRKSAATLRG